MNPSLFPTALWSEPLVAGENRDAAEISRHPSRGRGELCIAIADGVTQTLFAGPWAELLVKAASSGWPTLMDGAIHADLERLRQGFHPEFGSDTQLDRYREHSWQRVGSRATLLAATITRGADGQCQLQAMSVGDCELIVIGRGDVGLFPLKRSIEFTDQPKAVSTLPADQAAILRWTHAVAADDLIVFATDAVGRRLLTWLETAGDEHVLESLLRLLDADSTSLAAGLLDPDDSPSSFGDDATLVLCGATEPARGEDDVSALRRLLESRLGVQGVPPTPEARSRQNVLRRIGRVLRRSR